MSGGDNTIQLLHGVRTSSPAVHSKLLEGVSGQICVQIPTESSLAMEAYLSILWTKLPVMRR